MTLETVQRIFGIRYDNPDLKALHPLSINGQKATDVYHYPFKSLVLASQEVKDPVIDLISEEAAGGGAPEGRGGTARRTCPLGARFAGRGRRNAPRLIQVWLLGAIL